METLRKWKLEDAGECALLIDGACRVGKSYIVEAFAKAEYLDYVLINFKYVAKQEEVEKQKDVALRVRLFWLSGEDTASPLPLARERGSGVLTAYQKMIGRVSGTSILRLRREIPSGKQGPLFRLFSIMKRYSIRITLLRMHPFFIFRAISVAMSSESCQSRQHHNWIHLFAIGST